LSTVPTKSLSQEKPAEANATPRKKRVVIVGGGFAGIAAARALRRSDVDILLLGRRNHHLSFRTGFAFRRSGSGHI
jgi:NADH:quinone reductase (non-electrogenic)